MNLFSKYRKEVLMVLSVMGGIIAVAHLALGASRMGSRVVGVVASVGVALLAYYASYGIVAFQIKLHQRVPPFMKYFAIAAFYFFGVFTLVALGSTLRHIGAQPPFFLVGAGFALGMLKIYARHMRRREPSTEPGG